MRALTFLSLYQRNNRILLTIVRYIRSSTFFFFTMLSNVHIDYINILLFFSKWYLININNSLIIFEINVTSNRKFNNIESVNRNRFSWWTTTINKQANVCILSSFFVLYAWTHAQLIGPIHILSINIHSPLCIFCCIIYQSAFLLFSFFL
jgi:hypothetical protein